MTTRTADATVTIGTRGSKLALIQAEMLRSALAAQGVEGVAIEAIKTRGDAVTDRPLAAIGGDKGLFVAEIEQALRDGRISMAVHSAKDLPSQLPDDTRICAYLRRADPRDALVSRARTLAELPQGAKVGTSSPRRVAQLRAVRPDLLIADVRGNVDTRLRKLHDGEYDALILAAAGLIRIGLEGEISEYLDPDVMLPAVGQGALAIEIGAEDFSTAALLSGIADIETDLTVRTERSFLATVGGGCAAAVAGYAQVSGSTLRLRGLIGAADGRLVRGELSGALGEAEQLGVSLAEQLLADGGAELLTNMADGDPGED